MPDGLVRLISLLFTPYSSLLAPPGARLTLHDLYALYALHLTLNGLPFTLYGAEHALRFTFYQNERFDPLPSGKTNSGDIFKGEHKRLARMLYYSYRLKAPNPSTKGPVLKAIGFYALCALLRAF